MFGPNIGSLLPPSFCARIPAGEPGETVFRSAIPETMSAATRRVTGSCGLFFHDRFRGRIEMPYLYLVTDI